MKQIYLDHAATTPLSAAVRAAMEPWLTSEFGNPSSRHPLGVRASAAIDLARARVARAVGAREREVLFTSGGTEANNMAVLGAARARSKHGRHVLLGPTEHPSVREAAIALRGEGFQVDFLALDEHGALDLQSLQERARPDTVLVAQMLVQNEVGTIYPVGELARRLRPLSPHAHLHVDAIQALGKLELSMLELDADSLSLSAHKAHGPKGAGALILRERARLTPIVHGGGQERGLRSGTENVTGIVGLGTAVELAEAGREAACVKLCAVRSAFLEGVSQVDGVRVLAPGAERTGCSPAIVALLVPGAPAEVWLHHLEALGVYAAAGSACQSKKKEQSPTFAALGLSLEVARAVLRFSFDAGTSAEEAHACAEALVEIARGLAGVRA